MKILALIAAVLITLLFYSCSETDNWTRNKIRVVKPRRKRDASTFEERIRDEWLQSFAKRSIYVMLSE